MTSSSAPPDGSTAPSTANLRRLAAPGVGSLVQGGAALFWLPQAAWLAWAVQRLGAGEGIDAVWLPALGIVAMGALRAACE
ncbi:MAG: thiol reductant ABC exporter subunit CydD, partial [Variovorax sp.]